MSSEQLRLAHTRSDENLDPADNVESHPGPSDTTASDEHETTHQVIASDMDVEQGGQNLAQTSDSRPEDGIESRGIPNRELEPKHAREVVRLFQCRHCARPLRNPVTLPCGRSVCKSCIPETHARPSITYPAMPDRIQGFKCPFLDCAKTHALSDCGLDVILNKVNEMFGEEIAWGKDVASKLGIATNIEFDNPWDAAGIPSLHGSDSNLRTVPGGRLVSTWSLAAEGELALDAEITYSSATPAAPTQDDDAPQDDDVPQDDDAPQDDALDADTESLRRLQTLARSEMDCQVCYALFHDPFTTGCGHTFCRSCLHRTLDHSHRCPVCRRTLAINPLLNPEICPSNGCISRMIEMFWPQEKTARAEAVAADNAVRHGDLNIPVFVCALAFPSMPTFLHIFEPRYRLMLRRALEGSRIFGMVLPKRPQNHDDAAFQEMGTLLRIISAHYYPDGRSLIETVGLTRFRIVRHGELDGYIVAKTERIDDVSLEEEEAMEAAEVAASPTMNNGIEEGESSVHGDPIQTTEAQSGSPGEMDEDDGVGADSQGSSSSSPPPASTISASDLQAMSTQSLLRFATRFVDRMQSQSVPWLTDRMMAIYGQRPDDPATFPWWLASILPVRDLEKYRLLATSSVRERLKICCMWILEWETSRW